MVEIEVVDEAAEAARAAAETRRQKILDSAQDRINLVEGTTTTTKQPASTASGDDDDTNNNETGDATTTAAPTTSTSSRMAAMRRRRFKSKQQQETVKTADETNAADEESTTPPTKQAADGSVKAKDSDDEKEDDKLADAPALTAQAYTAPETKEVEANLEPVKPATTAGAAVVVSSEKEETVADEPKKKYEGVAKMRRRMLKEKQQAREDQDSNSAVAATTSKPAQQQSKTLASAKAHQATARPPLLPILMHAVTVLLLFLAGLDVGLQQRSIDYYGGALVTVHKELAPRRQLGGIAVVKKLMSGGGAVVQDDDSRSSGAASPNRILVEDSFEEAATLHDHDEFADVPADNSENEANIDPLFQVDLDQVTRGPGLLLMMGRFAVRVHRINLAIFWYGPRKFFFGLADWLLSLTTTPPILCLTAIVLRQLVGKAILGAHLPARVEDEKQHKDVMSMIKLFLTNFVLKSFPNAVRLYDVFGHVRADMYVLLCGLFVGLAFSHSIGGGSGSSAALEGMTQPPEEEQPLVNTEGLSDEL